LEPHIESPELAFVEPSRVDKLLVLFVGDLVRVYEKVVDFGSGASARGYARPTSPSGTPAANGI